jgi:hypothetical protein
MHQQLAPTDRSFFVLKSGCSVQDLALRSAQAILATIALYMVIAWRILYLRDFSRARPELSSEHFIEPVELTIVALLAGEKPNNRAPPSLHKIIGMIGRLGGHLGRTHDGQPGVKTLRLGLTRLNDAVFVQQKLAEAGKS